jgi:hypothetical protein
MIGSIVLGFIAYCGQRIDNLLLIYITSIFGNLIIIKKNHRFCFLNLALVVCLIPGICHQRLIEFIRQYISDFWNNKKSEINKPKIQ